MYREDGELGIRNFEAWNQSLIAKHVWDVAKEKASMGCYRFMVTTKKAKTGGSIRQE